ncbi:hypothetical protein Pelo_7200 [Pelomyxa schiedti]|nr:hypothetical protein Pelo_7200 [Pelomyxa schiedti]
MKRVLPPGVVGGGAPILTGYPPQPNYGNMGPPRSTCAPMGGRGVNAMPQPPPQPTPSPYGMAVQPGPMQVPPGSQYAYGATVAVDVQQPQNYGGRMAPPPGMYQPPQPGQGTRPGVMQQPGTMQQPPVTSSMPMVPPTGGSAFQQIGARPGGGLQSNIPSYRPPKVAWEPPEDEQSMFRCPLCVNVLEDPVELDCSCKCVVCQQCAGSLSAMAYLVDPQAPIPCPTCLKPVTVEKCIEAKETKEGLPSWKEAQAKRHLCAYECGKATIQCSNDHNLFCSTECFNRFHGEIPAYLRTRHKAQTYVPTEESQIMCTAHSSAMCDLFCMQCNGLICTQCVMPTGGHADHPCARAFDMIEDNLNVISPAGTSSQLNTGNGTMGAFKKIVEDEAVCIAAIDQETLQVEQVIRDHRSNLMSAFKELQDALSKRMAEQEQEIANLEKETKQFLADQKQALQIAHSSHRRLTEVEAELGCRNFLILKLTRSRLDTLLSEFERGRDRALTPCKQASFISVGADHSQLLRDIKAFGYLGYIRQPLPLNVTASELTTSVETRKSSFHLQWVPQLLDKENDKEKITDYEVTVCYFDSQRQKHREDKAVTVTVPEFKLSDVCAGLNFTVQVIGHNAARMPTPPLQIPISTTTIRAYKTLLADEVDVRTPPCSETGTVQPFPFTAASTPDNLLKWSGKLAAPDGSNVDFSLQMDPRHPSVGPTIVFSPGVIQNPIVDQTGKFIEQYHQYLSDQFAAGPSLVSFLKLVHSLVFPAQEPVADNQPRGGHEYTQMGTGDTYQEGYPPQPYPGDQQQYTQQVQHMQQFQMPPGVTMQPGANRY